jgi:hypothetical protein
MSNITAKERAVLRAIRDSEFNDGHDTSAIWTFSVWDNVDRTVVTDRASLGGVIASCVAKGLVSECGRGRDAEIALTQAGLDAVSAGDCAAE